MKLSIIVTLYNRLEMCTRLLFKLQEQIEKNKAKGIVQVVVINDGSTEEQEWLKPIENLCKEYGFTYHYQKNGGEAAARNSGIDYSTGEYFTYVDCDDDIVPEYLENVLDGARYDWDVVAFKWIYKDDGVAGEWHEKPLVNWNVWSWIYKTEKFKGYRFDTNRIIASDYFWLEDCFKKMPNLKICYADDKRTIIYNSNNPNNLTNRFSRGEVEANRKGGNK